MKMTLPKLPNWGFKKTCLTIRNRMESSKFKSILAESRVSEEVWLAAEELIAEVKDEATAAKGEMWAALCEEIGSLFKGKPNIEEDSESPEEDAAE